MFSRLGRITAPAASQVCELGAWAANRRGFGRLTLIRRALAESGGWARRPEAGRGGRRMSEVAGLVASPEAWIALLTLIVMEVVLGVDNLVFVSILSNKLPEARRAAARRIGIGLAL